MFYTSTVKKAAIISTDLRSLVKPRTKTAPGFSSFFTFALGAALFFFPVHAERSSEKVKVNAAYVKIVKVIDGDTLVVKLIDMGQLGADNRGKIKVRLVGVDAPEVPENGYAEAKKAVKAWVKQEQGYAIAIQGPPMVDKYGRVLCLMLPTDYKGLDTSLNCLLLREGHARFMDIPHSLLPAVEKCND